MEVIIDFGECVLFDFFVIIIGSIYIGFSIEVECIKFYEDGEWLVVWLSVYVNFIYC